MNLEIRDIPFEKRLYGRSKPVLEDQKPVDAMFAAMDETWGIVRGNSIPNEDPAKLVVELLIGLK